MAKKPHKKWEHHGLYGLWSHMMKRCYDPKARNFDNYGARGIRVCDRWHCFQSFKADMSPRPEGMTLDRKNNNGNYEPDNCQWATRAQQLRNQRVTRIITFQGETMCLKDWAAKLGWNYNTLQERVVRGWPIEKALTVPPSFRNSGLKYRRIGAVTRHEKVKHDPVAEGAKCARGHELTAETIFFSASGKPSCKICDRAKGRIRAGWPEDLAYSMPTVAHGHRPINATGFRKKRLQSQSTPPQVQE